MTASEPFRLPPSMVQRARDFRGEPAPAKPAATVVLLRPSGSAFQVYVLRRATTMVFGGVHAFPGGGVDPTDQPATIRHDWSALLGIPDNQAQAVVGAAARELFEETGVLLADPTPDHQQTHPTPDRPSTQPTAIPNPLVPWKQAPPPDPERPVPWKQAPPLHADTPVPWKQAPPHHRSGPVSRKQAPPDHHDSPVPWKQAPPHDADGPVSRKQGPTHEADADTNRDGPLSTKQAPSHHDGPVSREQAPTHDADSPNSREQAPRHDPDDPVSWKQAPPHDHDDPVSWKQAPPHDPDSPVTRKQGPTHEADTDTNRDGPLSRKQAPPHDLDGPVSREQAPTHGHDSPVTREQAPRHGHDGPVTRKQASPHHHDGPISREQGAFGGGLVGNVSGGNWEADRVAVAGRELTMTELLERRGLRLRDDLLLPWARWITPEFEPRRFDTWFFVAFLPDGQAARDVSGEAEGTQWIYPAEAGGLAMLPPTRAVLDSLTAYREMGEIVAAARRRDAATPVVPRVVFTEDGGALLHIG